MFWEFLFDNILGTIWAIFKGGLLGILLAIGIYKLVSFYWGWKVGRVRYLVLALWLVALPIGCSATFALFSTEDTARKVIESETAPTARILGARVGEPILLLALQSEGGHSAGAGDAPLRVHTTLLVASRQSIADSLDRIHADVVATIKESDEGIARSLRLWVVDTTYDVLATEERQRLREVDGFIRELETIKADDGTVGTEEFSQVIGDRYLRPKIHKFSESIFHTLRLYVYLLLLLLILLPLLTCQLWPRRRKATKLEPDADS